MKEHSAGVIIVRKERGKFLYLLLHYQFKTEYWDLPRGNVEKGETEKQAAMREIKEETGITDIKFVEGFHESVSWFYKRNHKTIAKSVTFFLADTKQSEVKLSAEHIGYEWLEYENAYKRATFENTKLPEFLMIFSHYN